MKFNRHKTVDALLADALPGDKEIADAVNKSFSEDSVANHLFILRTKAGLSQSDMAKLLNVSQSVISKMENDGNYLRFNDVIRYVNALGFSAEMAFIKKGRAVDFLRSYFSRIAQMMNMLCEMAGDDPDINAGILTAFGDFSKSMMDNVLPKFEKFTTSRLSALEISVITPPAENPPHDVPKHRKRPTPAALPAR